MAYSIKSLHVLLSTDENGVVLSCTCSVVCNNKLIIVTHSILCVLLLAIGWCNENRIKRNEEGVQER